MIPYVNSYWKYSSVGDFPLVVLPRLDELLRTPDRVVVTMLLSRGGHVLTSTRLYVKLLVTFPSSKEDTK